MQTLAEAIASFQRQLRAALNPAQPAADDSARSWQADRVTLDLEVTVGADGIARVDDPGSERSRHRVSIEFKLSAPNEGAAKGASASPNWHALEIPDSPASDPRMADKDKKGRAVSQLATIFGEPGFDSSARAAVFCEALRVLTPAQTAALPATLVAPGKSVVDEQLRRARHLIRGVVHSGPLKSAERASELLQSLLTAWSVAELVSLIEVRWKPEETWTT